MTKALNHDYVHSPQTAKWRFPQMTYSIEALSNSTQFFKISGQFYWGQAHSIPNQIIHIFSKSKFIYALHEKYDFLSLMIRYLWNAYQSLSILIVWFTTHKKYNKIYWLYVDVQTFFKNLKYWFKTNTNQLQEKRKLCFICTRV